MKRISILPLLLLIILAGCSTDETPSYNELIGSCWYQEDSNYPHYSHTAYFAIDGNCTFEFGYGDMVKPLSVKYKYSYNKPNITIKHLTGAVFATGTVQDNVMYLDAEDESYVLQKVR